MKPNERLKLLAMKLKQYGLNPMDWRIEPSARSKFRIYQPANKDFEFEGTVDRRLRWIDFELKLNFAAC